MKILIILLLITCVYCSSFSHRKLLSFQKPQPGQCSLNITCVKKGAHCDDMFYFCNKGYYCDFNSQTCTRLLTNGNSCEYPGECKSDYCDETCQDIKTAKLGESCVQWNCVESAYCDYNQNYTCVRLPLSGEKCTDTCAGAAFCSNDGICKDQFSQPEGAYCQTTTSCKPGLFCNRTYTCKTPAKASNKPCSSDSDCEVDEECECPDYEKKSIYTCVGPLVYTVPHASVYIDYANCVAKHDECSYETENGKVHICSKCKLATCAYYKELIDSFYKGLPQCAYGNYMLLLDNCHNATLIWLPITIALIIVLVVSLSLGVWFYKRRDLQKTTIRELKPLVSFQ